VLGRWELRDRLVAQLAGGPLRDDELSVVDEAAKQALRGHFGDKYDVRSVAAFALRLRDSWRLPVGSDVMELEAVMRTALGEPDIDMGGITASARLEAYFFSVMQIARERESGGTAVRQRIHSRGRIHRADSRGFRPGSRPTATDA
jgi:hypothetical protein